MSNRSIRAAQLAAAIASISTWYSPLAAAADAAVAVTDDAAAKTANDKSGSELETVIVNARFRTENLQETPLAITALSADDVTKMGFTDMSEVGRAVPNAYFRQDSAAFGRSTAIYIRGVGQNDFQASQEPRTATYIDDVYFQSVFGSMYDLLDLDQIEVLRGPQGTLFGRNAMGGAVRMVTQKPSGQDGGSVSATYGERNLQDLRGTFNTTLIDNTLFLRVSGASKKQDGYQKNLDFTCQMVRNGTPQLAGIGDGVARLRQVGPDGILSPTDPYLPDQVTPANQVGNPYYALVAGTNTVGSVQQAYGINPGPKGDYPVALNPGINPTSLATARADDNALSIPSRIDNYSVGGSRGCQIGESGGIDTHAVRAQLRWVASDNVEVNFTAFYSADDSEPTPLTLFDVGDGTVSNKVGTTAGLGGITTVNNLVNIPRYGVPYDARFVTNNPYQSYATFTDLAQGKIWPLHSTTTIWGGSNVTDFKLNDTTSLKWILAYHHTQGEFGDDRDESPLTLQDTWNTVQETETSTELRLSGQALHGRDSWTVGGFYWRDRQENGATVDIVQLALTTIPVGGGNYAAISPFWLTQDHSNARNYGFYANSIYDLTNTWSLTTGLRYSNDHKVFFFNHQFSAVMDADGSSTDWKVGLDKKFTPNILGFVSVATGYTAPSFNARPFAANQFIGQPAEKLINYEMGIKSDWFDKKLRVNGNIFYADYKERIIGVSNTQINGIPESLPIVSPAQISGVELELNANPVAGLLLGLTGGTLHFHATGIAGNGAPNLPKFQASANIGYRFPFASGASITPRLDAFYTSLVYLTAPALDPQPAYTLLNSRVTYLASSGKWETGVGVKNLTNRYYAMSTYDLRTATLGTGDNVPSPPREWSVFATYHF